jgi:hypothetical protein
MIPLVFTSGERSTMRTTLAAVLLAASGSVAASNITYDVHASGGS